MDECAGARRAPAVHPQPRSADASGRRGLGSAPGGQAGGLAPSSSSTRGCHPALDVVPDLEFVKGTIEDIPLPESSVDVVISNCVINLSGDKHQTLREAARVLKPGGRFAVSDVIADEAMDEKTREDMAAWTGCIAGALTQREFVDALEAAGFEGIEIQETHRVHEAAASAIVRATKPGAGS